MTGPEHYREAEHLVTAPPSCACNHSGCWHEQMQIARAQVHATLALAAATAVNDFQKWCAVAIEPERRDGVTR
jgi:hypothetical protein